MVSRAATTRTNPRRIPTRGCIRKSQAAPALLSYLGQVLTDNRHGLLVNVQASLAEGRRHGRTRLRRADALRLQAAP
jgi:hypothetical protein